MTYEQILEMTKVAISLEFVNPGRVGGAEQEALAIIEGLKYALTSDDNLVIFSNSVKKDSHNIEWATPSFKVNNRFIQESITFYRNKKEYHSYLFPNYFTPPIDKGPTKVITVINDVQYIHLPEYTPYIKAKWLGLTHKTTLRRADVVLAISDFVRNDILNIYGNEYEDKVMRIYSPVDWDLFREEQPIGPNSLLDCKYLLSVSAQWPHKNLVNLIKAFKILHRTDKDVKLVLVGQLSSNLGGRFIERNNITQALNERGLKDAILVTGYVDDATLTWLYRRCSLFVFPSLFEGFGRPAVEALGLGAPVLTNKYTSLFEVTKGYANYIDNPLDENEISDKMKQILESPDRYRPTEKQISDIRNCYDKKVIGKQYYDILFHE